MICSKCTKEYIDDGKQSKMCPSCRSNLGKRSRSKGYTDEKRFEKFFQKELDKYELPYKIMRCPRSGGIGMFECSDFLFRFLPQDSWLSRMHIEKKDRANWDIVGWWEEARRKEEEFGGGREPVIISRKPNDTEDYVTMKKEFFTKIILELETLTQQNK